MQSAQQQQQRRNVQSTLAGRLRRHQVGSTPTSTTPTDPIVTFEGSMKSMSISETEKQQQNNMDVPLKKSSTPSSEPTKTISSSLKEEKEITKSTSQKEDPTISLSSPTTTGKNGGSRAMRGMLTQAGKEGESSSTPSAPSSPNPGHQRQAGRNATRTTPTFPSQQGQPTLNHRKLALWQQQPMNLSPATHLGLPPMLPNPLPHLRNKPLLVLDVDETLVHASFTPAKPYNVHIIIEVDGEQGDIFVAYRPHLFTFLDAIVDWFEVAIFTASQSCYADQLLDHIDPQGRLGRLRLFREHCTEINGARVKDLSLLGRPLHRVALIDNSPVTYVFQPRNGIPILSWFEDTRDVELLKLLPMLRQMSASESVYDVLDVWRCSQ